MITMEEDFWVRSVDYGRYAELMQLELGPADERVLGYPPGLHRYVGLNLRRMERWTRKQPDVSIYRERLRDLPEGLRVLVLTEGWCGDSAHIIPFAQMLVDQLTGIQMRYLFRDENPELMGQFLTRGTRSIPKFILFDPEGKVMGSWGPRPEEIQEWYLAAKKLPGADQEALAAELQNRYNRDKGAMILEEFSYWLLDEALSGQVVHNQ